MKYFKYGMYKFVKEQGKKWGIRQKRKSQNMGLTQNIFTILFTPFYSFYEKYRYCFYDCLLSKFIFYIYKVTSGLEKYIQNKIHSNDVNLPFVDQFLFKS